jgi:ABC-type multidrug transport system fused ATPase/permease subunit
VNIISFACLILDLEGLNVHFFRRLITRKYIKKIVGIQQEAGLNVASFLEERLNHIAMVKMSNRENDEVESYNEMQDRLVTLGTRSAFANGLSMGTMFFLSTGALCSILLTGGKAVEAKKMEHGQLVSFGTYSFLLALGSAGVVKAMGEFQQGRQSAARLYRLVIQNESGTKEEDTKAQSRAVVDFSAIRHLKVNNLQFSYESNPSSEVLRDVSVTLSRGEVVAMVGKNGAGKSTIAMILAGMYKPKSGSVLVEHDEASTAERKSYDYVRDLERAEQAKLVQVVPQHPAIFGATILENVKYTRPEATEEEVMEALRAANAEHFVSKLEGGLMYSVGRNGSRLSGGQRQRIGLARALLANPMFLVLDEPASSLDAEGESAIGDAIKACRASDRSLLVITHRVKTVMLADRVVVLKEGQVAEQGIFSELQTKGGELVKLMPDLV